MVKKRIVIGSILLLGMIGLGVTYLAVVKENDSSQDDTVKIEVKKYDYSDSQGDYGCEDADVTEDIYEYEYEDDDTEEIEVKRHDYTQ